VCAILDPTTTTINDGHDQRRTHAQFRLRGSLLGNMLKPDEEQSFFDRERDKLTGEIATVRVFFFATQPRRVSVLTYP
jgi:hypothetical protein